MKVLANTLRPGHAIEHEGKKYVVVKYELILPGKGNAFIAVDMRDAITGVKTNERFRTQETVEKLMTSEKTCTMLFAEGELINLMDTETFDQFNVPVDMAGEAKIFLTEGMEVTVDTVDDVPVGVRLPMNITLEIIEADAVVKGQTASSSYKPAVLENGVKTMVPPHISVGTRVVINTADATYVERAKD
ncbi:MAG: elongation factor P [Rhodospirillaceae bacterium]|jgi:elongation factor P|nr:elongation factor P [Rhodospirillaceae bacterium]MBI77051.1 elongation factor P [Rhodospirillaceae bacterium]MBS40333.1 elongation factor P [Rhodospirillales bacterium]|tara:strand:- start:311 stop:877 length:567 start_codon:yes stop_codon:yes gene_type:complete